MSHLLKVTLVLAVSVWGFIARAEMSEDAQKAEKIYSCKMLPSDKNAHPQPAALIYVNSNNMMKVRSAQKSTNFVGHGDITTLHGSEFKTLTSDTGVSLFFDPTKGQFSVALSNSPDLDTPMDCSVLGDKTEEEVYLKRLGRDGDKTLNPEYLRSMNEMEGLDKDAYAGQKKSASKKAKAKYRVSTADGLCYKDDEKDPVDMKKCPKVKKAAKAVPAKEDQSKNNGKWSGGKNDIGDTVIVPGPAASGAK